MHRRSTLASRARRMNLALAPVGLFSAVLVAVACSGATQNTAATTPPPPDSRFVAVDEDAPAPDLDPDALLELAMAGVSEPRAEGDQADGELGSRFEVRPLRIPSPPRGGTARFSFEQGQRGWVTALPNAEVLTTPTYGDGKVFLGGGFASHRFFAFDAFGGEMQWSLAAPDGGPTAALYERDRVLFNTESCTIFVANADTGELIWKRWLGDPLMSQPATAGDLVLSAYPKDGGHRFGAYDVADGTPRWDVAIPADIIQAPQVHGDSAYFATMDGTAFRVRWRDGRVLWRKPVRATSALWVHEGKVLLSQSTGRGRARQERPVALSVRTGAELSHGAAVPAPYLAGNSRDRQLGASQAGAWGGVPHGEHLGLRNVASGWAFQGSSPVVADGRAYTAVGAELRARDLETGEIVWTRRDPNAGDAQTISPPAVIGSQLVYGTVDGHLYFTDIDTGMTIRGYDVGEPVIFQPIVAQGWVYVATGRGRLIGLEIGDPHLDGWHMWGGNAQHAGLVDTAGAIAPQLLASLDRPGRGTLRVAGLMDDVPPEGAAADEGEVANDATGTGEEVPVADALVESDLPQVGVEVEAEVTGFVARVVVTQTFENPHEHAIEAKYLFPLPDESAVDAMEMRIGDRIVEGVIRERQQARREYEAARSEGRRAALLEQQRPNLFVQRVANIQPFERVQVRLEYVQTLAFDQAEGEGAYELVFPMSAPRRSDARTHGQAADGDEARQADTIALRVNVNAGLPLGDVASPSHEVRVERGARGRATITLGDGAATDRDFVLRYGIRAAQPDATVFAHRAPVGPDDDGSANGYFSMLVQPPAMTDDAPATPREITFVLDRSSSMRGAPMSQARAVMQEVLGTLGPDDAFDLVTFSDRVEPLHGAPVAATEEAKADALARLADLDVVGSTRVIPAMEHALGTPATDGADRLRIAVLLSDGYVGNEAQVLRSLVRELGDARVFALGLGGAQNRFLLDRASEVGRGAAMYASLGEDAAEVGRRFAQLVARPVFTDVRIDWGGLEVQDVYPRRLPDLFAGRPLVVHGRFDEGGTRRVKIRGTMNGQRYERSFTVRLPKTDRAAAGMESQATLWARAAVKDRMQRLTLRDDPALIAEVTALGLRHSMVTPWTSFVAVERRQARAEAEESEESPQSRSSISPARSLPGDPEIRVPAPRDARLVTLVLPFGETVEAAYEPHLDVWSGRFLVPSDAEEGTFPVEILVTHASGEVEHLRVWYTVDEAAPVMEVELLERGGARVLRAEQVVTDADLEQVGTTRSALTEARAQMLHDARRVELRVGDEVLPLELVGPGAWEVALPEGAAGDATLVVVDLAANVRTQAVSL